MPTLKKAKINLDNSNFGENSKMKYIKPEEIDTIVPEGNSCGINVCILARKKLYRNTRVVRQTKVLIEAGHNVTVVAIEIPSPELQKQTIGAKYIEIVIDPLILRIVRWIKTPKRIYKKTRGALKKVVKNAIREIAIAIESVYRNTIKCISNFAKKIFEKTKSAVRSCKKIGVNLILSPLANMFSAMREKLRILAGGSKDVGSIEKIEVSLIKEITSKCLQKTASIAYKLLLKVEKIWKWIIIYAGPWVWKRFVNILKPIVKCIKVIANNIKLYLKMILDLVNKEILKYWRKFGSFAEIVAKRAIRSACRPFKKVWDFIGAKKLLISQFINEKMDKSLQPAISLSKSVDFAKKSAKATTHDKFDICQAHDSYSLLAADRLRKRDNALLIYDALEIDDDRSANNLQSNENWVVRNERARNEKVIKRADMVLGVGPSLAKWTQERYHLSMPVTVIRNCTIYHDKYTNNIIKKDIGLTIDEKLALVIGSIYNNQGFEQLIAALKKLPNNIHIAALGPSAMTNYIQSLYEEAHKAGVGDRFHILPPQEPQDLIEYASGADIGIIARQNTCLNNEKSMPNKIFELVMARLPIASSRLPDIAALINEHSIGMIFDEKNPKNIADVILKMLDNKNIERMKENVNEAAKKLCWEEESKKYLAAVESLVSQDIL